MNGPGALQVAQGSTQNGDSGLTVTAYNIAVKPTGSDPEKGLVVKPGESILIHIEGKVGKAYAVPYMLEIGETWVSKEYVSVLVNIWKTNDGEKEEDGKKYKVSDVA